MRQKTLFHIIIKPSQAWHGSLSNQWTMGVTEKENIFYKSSFYISTTLLSHEKLPVHNSYSKGLTYIYINDGSRIVPKWQTRQSLKDTSIWRRDWHSLDFLSVQQYHSNSHKHSHLLTAASHLPSLSYPIGIVPVPWPHRLNTYKNQYKKSKP